MSYPLDWLMSIHAVYKQLYQPITYLPLFICISLSLFVFVFCVHMAFVLKFVYVLSLYDMFYSFSLCQIKDLWYVNKLKI